ncbi:heparinase II/III-family protein [Compostibacter hankyongensis]|uniref:Heparinase II/III-family protein n=2 Tax=Compostibacter hankyongensis TaxID=1007089 RepID=A0ABP8FNS2_9BACT
MRSYVKEAESYLNYEWPSIPATTSLLIVRTGDRSRYEAISFKKRQVLGTLLLAEIYENKGRFIDPIVNGIWSICEESFWGASAHIPKTKENAGLIDVSDPFVELFSAETATYLAWADYFLGDKLDAVSPQIRKRIYYEVNNRIFRPLMTKYHGWMGKNGSGRRPNNWNPWICSNWLNAALLLERDDEKRAAMIAKALHVLDQFLNPYPADGGCDEGPSYWSAAGASLYDCIAMLNLASHGAFRYVFHDPKVVNIGKYIYRAQISDTYFLNFADAPPQPGMDGELIYRFGKDIADPDMVKFGAYYRRSSDGKLGRFHFFRNFYSLFMQDEYSKAEKALPLPEDVWLPDLQVMAARDKAGSTAGFYLAAKGGNNDESHNHNDIGNFVVYYNGQPLIIDVGSGTYTSRTFSDKRYDIWYNRSDYHNTPTINGQPQPAGSAFKAEQVSYKATKSSAAFSLDMASAYPSGADINSWRRTIQLNRGKAVTVTDDIDLKNARSYTEHMMTVYPAEVAAPGRLLIHYRPEQGKARDFLVKYDARQWNATVEKVKLGTMEDQGILKNWGDRIYRISFEAAHPQKRGKGIFVITPQ